MFLIGHGRHLQRAHAINRNCLPQPQKREGIQCRLSLARHWASSCLNSLHTADLPLVLFLFVLASPADPVLATSKGPWIPGFPQVPASPLISGSSLSWGWLFERKFFSQDLFPGAKEQHSPPAVHQLGDQVVGDKASPQKG